MPRAHCWLTLATPHTNVAHGLGFSGPTQEPTSVLDAGLPVVPMFQAMPPQSSTRVKTPSCVVQTLLQTPLPMSRLHQKSRRTDETPAWLHDASRLHHNKFPPHDRFGSCICREFRCSSCLADNGGPQLSSHQEPTRANSRTRQPPRPSTESFRVPSQGMLSCYSKLDFILNEPLHPR